MNVAVILCGEKQRLFVAISLSANTVAEFTNHLVDNTQGQHKRIVPNLRNIQFHLTEHHQKFFPNLRNIQFT